MARLNYTARRISGIKAGQALKKDLAKRIPTTPNFKDFKTRDPVMDIDISGRQLTDDGFNEFIFELRLALESRTPEYPQGANKLQELHLRGNLLTVNSLVELAKVVSVSSQDLRELDISNNNINILTDSDNRKWQYFLQSFSQCCVLKKVDFSNNLLGARGIEILARVFIRSELDFVETDTDSNTDASAKLIMQDERRSSDPDVLVPSSSTAPGSHSNSQGTKSAQRRGSQVTAASKTPSDADLRHFACTRGLRSIPYLILQNVAMTNGGVIHLAEMLKLHRHPDHLLAFVPGGKHPSLPDPENAIRGIYWLPNDELSPLSGKLMRLTDQLQQYTNESETEDELAEDLQEMGIYDYSYERRKQRQKLDQEISRTLKLHRIDVLGSEGLMRSEIWRSALKMLTVARAILLDDNNRPSSAEEELQTTKKSRSALLEEVREIPTPTPIRAQYPFGQNTQEEETPPGVLISSFRFDPESSTFDIMFPAIHRPPENGILRASPPPVAAVMSTYPSSVKHSRQASVSQQSKDKDKMPAHESHNSHSRPKGITDNNGVRDKDRFGLPLRIWRVIISDALEVNGILHPDQQMKILDYAASWAALAREISINGALEHQQMWKILDSIDCFTYKSLS